MFLSFFFSALFSYLEAIYLSHIIADERAVNSCFLQLISGKARTLKKGAGFIAPCVQLHTALLCKEECAKPRAVASCVVGLTLALNRRCTSVPGTQKMQLELYIPWTLPVDFRKGRKRLLSNLIDK